jgi:hypothetical protein
MSRITQKTDPRLSWIPLEDQPKRRRTPKRKGAPWTASRSASTAPQPPDEPTEADVKREWDLLWEAKAEYERNEAMLKQAKKIIKRLMGGAMRDELKAANRRLREEMANYRHQPLVVAPDGTGATTPPLQPASHPATSL